MCSARTINFVDGASSASAPTGVDGISQWVTAQGYLVDDVVINGSKIYKCLIAHTAGTFATDLAAAKWTEISQGAVDHTALSNIGTNTHAQIDTHIGSTSNPHSTTATQVGLGNCNNTSDANKPISSATQTALNALNPMTTGGDMIYGGASGAPTRLANGSAGQVFTSSGTTAAPTWSTPSTANSFNAVSNLSFVASVATNALTITIKDSAGATPSAATTAIGFRSSTLTSGAYVVRSITSALSIVVSSGSTLGHANNVAKNIWLYAIDNAGTVELAVSSAQFDDSLLYTTTAEGGAGAADSDSVLYSTTARSNVAIRLIGRLLSTQTTAGTWAAVPTDVAMYSSKGQHAYAYYTGTPPTGTLNASLNPITFGTKVWDSHGAYSGGTYTIPFNGVWSFDSQVFITGSYTVGKLAELALYLDGSILLDHISYASGTLSAVTMPKIGVEGLYLRVGQTVVMRTSSDATTPVYSSSTGVNYFSAKGVAL